jgi:hypothetical protein
VVHFPTAEPTEDCEGDTDQACRNKQNEDGRHAVLMVEDSNNQVKPEDN